MDVAGATSEWTEEIGYINGVYPGFRIFDGSE